ncbi:MAG: porin [Deltaproteobacteria bacterium]|nr:porin [Deltaproteobacteria bacterium]
MTSGSCANKRKRTTHLAVSLLLVIQIALGGPATALAAGTPTVNLYVDETSGQVFTKPGPGRTHLGTFKRVETDGEPAPVAPAAAPKKPAKVRTVPAATGPAPAVPAAPAPPPGVVPAETAPPPGVVPAGTVPPPAGETAPVPVEAAAPEKPEAEKGVIQAVVKEALASKWYERISLRGYVQTRYTALLDKDSDADWFVPADRSVRDGGGIYLRRARMIFSGDITDHLYIYIQPDLNAAPADGDFSVQLRDAYADISIDEKKEFRFRVGQSKVPFGWVNMQSSQNRIPLERPEAFNSAVEGERDVGVFFYWAPAEIRERFRYLVSSGLKGSGDYGVTALGVYNGQGLNRLDQNNDVYVVGRVSYPFKLGGGQFFEPGIQGYWGRFVPRVAAIGDPAVTPSAPKSGVLDRRLAISAVLYPQPFGFETEWTVGDGPELVDDQRIESKSLWGGYAQAYYQWKSPWGVVFPFVRWQYYDGGRKFARNAPFTLLNEWDFGVEWAFLQNLEFTIDYAYSARRTNTNTYPYDDIVDGSRIGFQLQFSY